MSQRLKCTKVNPITGETMVPLWYEASGAPFYPIIGASPENDEDDEAEGTDDGSGSGTTDSEGQDAGDGDGKTYTKAEMDALSERMKAADRRAATAEQKVKEFEDKDKDEATKTAERIKALEEQTEKDKEALRDLTVQNAFLAANDIDWHDKDVALAHANLSEVLDAEGNVDKKALKKALEDLSKDKPFLVKAKAEGDGDGTPAPPSGAPVGSGRKGSRSGELDEEALKRKYPALYV